MGGSRISAGLPQPKSLSHIHPNAVVDPVLAWWRTAWPERLAAVAAIAGVLLGVLPGFHPRTWQASGSDLKTLYASAALFRQHLDPYSFTNIAVIFEANRVVPPHSWYGHAPVYPPFTLALMAPLTLLPMVPAVYVWVMLTATILAAAAFALTRTARRIHALGRPWRMLLIALFAVSPLLSFGLEMGNVSPLVCGLCIIAVANPARTSRGAVLNAIALTIALILKPHLAFWVIVALLFSRTGGDRTLALRSLALVAIGCLAIVAWMGAHHQLLAQLASYRNMVHFEVSGGSMDASTQEKLAVSAQITSLASLLGYWFHGLSLEAFNIAGLVLILAALVAASLTDPVRESSTRLTCIAAWSAFGLIATYHRAHDGIFLLVLLPWLLARLRTSWRDPIAWAFIALSTVMAYGPTWETSAWLATIPGLAHLATFMLFRQSPFATLFLLLLLIAEIARPAPRRRRPAGMPAEEMRELPVAAA